MRQIPQFLPPPDKGKLPAFPAGYTITEPPEFDRARIRRCIAVLNRFRLRICVFVAASMIATAFVSARLTPIYESAATIEMDRQVPAGVLGQDAAQFPSADADQFLTTQLKLIQSDSVLRPVARRFNLAVRQARAGETATAQSTNSEAPIELKGMRVARVANTYLVQIRYRSPDPKMAADVANAIANSYIQHSYTTRYNASVSLAAFMEAQLVELKAKMERSSVALARFERELNVINPEEKTSILSARLLQLNSEYTNAQSDRVRKEAAYNMVKNGSPEAVQFSPQGEALRKLWERLGEAQEKFAQVKAHYGVNHPEYRRSEAQIAQLESELQGARRNLVRAVEVEYHQAADREEMLRDTVAQSKADLDRLNARSFQYQTVKRDAEADRKLYEELTRKIKEAGINAAFHDSAIRLADAARPMATPVFPKMGLNLLLAFLCSTVLAGAAAFLADALDDRVRDPREIARLLNTDVIGALPFVRSLQRPDDGSHLLPAGAAGSQTQALATVERMAVFEDAIRVLLHSILLGSTQRPLRSILISSAFPKEGKTTIAAHLAIASARQKQRTLLIDGDMRCPAVSGLLNLGMEKGLARVLQNGSEWRKELIHAPGIPELDILPAGPNSRRAADLVGRSLSALLHELQAEYDLVIVDAPPLLGFPEPLQMAAAADSVLLVARAGRTHEEALDSVIGMLQRIRANVVGLVLNEAQYPGRGGRPYYGYARRGQYYAT